MLSEPCYCLCHCVIFQDYTDMASAVAQDNGLAVVGVLLEGSPHGDEVMPELFKEVSKLSGGFTW